MPYLRNLIIDGHGRELTSQTFDFRRAQGNECILYCYVHQGIGIGIEQSNRIIADAINGNISLEIAGTQLSSKIGGTLVGDKELGAIRLNRDGRPQWNNDGLFAGGPHRINIEGVDVDEFVHNNSTYIRLPINSVQTLKLSQIINHYNVGQYNILWCVCRSE